MIYHHIWLNYVIISALIFFGPFYSSVVGLFSSESTGMLLSTGNPSNGTALRFFCPWEDFAFCFRRNIVLPRSSVEN